jgi:hypothetical protein
MTLSKELIYSIYQFADVNTRLKMRQTCKIMAKYKSASFTKGMNMLSNNIKLKAAITDGPYNWYKCLSIYTIYENYRFVDIRIGDVPIINTSIKDQYKIFYTKFEYVNEWTKSNGKWKMER